MSSPEVLGHTSEILITLAPFFLAFSFKVRKKIWERDQGKCVRCGSTIGCECAHINHNKMHPKYDHPSNGRVLCGDHHLDDHSPFKANSGLTREENDYAIGKITERISK